MKSYFCSETEDTPFVELNPEKNKFIFAKRSLPENAYQFYQPIITWITEFFDSTDNECVFEFMFDYYNTSSSKQILKILNLLERYKQNGKDIKIKWYHLEEDDDMKVSGNRFAMLCDIQFEIIEYYPETYN